MGNDFRQHGAFNIDGQWATAVRWQADVTDGTVSAVRLHFVNGRHRVASANVLPDQLREVLGESNEATIGSAVREALAVDTSAKSVKGKLRGAALAYGQAVLPGHEDPGAGNTVERADRVREGAAAPYQADPPTPAEAAPEEPDAGPPPRPDPSAVPAWVAQRFIRVEDRYYFPDRTHAFTDRGTRLQAPSDNAEVIRGLVAIAEARGWDAVTVKGTQEFRRTAWREAALRGIEVHGYRASDVEREALQREMAGSTAATDAPPPGQPSASGKPARETTRPGNGQQAVTGRLLEAGAAPYRFDDTQGTSYFVRVQTDRGEKVLWGVDLERALAQSRSGVQVGDMVTVRSLGAKPVSVDAPRHDEAGRVVGHETVATRRRTWQVEKPEFVEQQAAKAAAFRDDAVPRTRLVEEHPDLTSAVVGLWLGEQFAARRIERPEDRKRLVALVRQRLAEAIERGEPIDTPKVRQAVARDLEGAAPDGEREDRGVASDPVRARTRGARAPEVPPHARA